MVQVSPEVPNFASFVHVPLYYTVDRLKGQGPIIAFCGPSAVSNDTRSSSRIQAHIFTSAGFRSYPRLTITPVSELYEAVNHLLPEHRGDEVRRGLAGALFKYYLDVNTNLGVSDAGHLASNMAIVTPVEGIIGDLGNALQPQHISHLEVDVSLPNGSHRAGAYHSLVESLGTQVAGFGRAPASTVSSADASSLRQQVQELCETELRYIEKLQRLVEIARELRRGPPSEYLELFPAALDRILQAHKDAKISQSQGVTALGKILVDALPKFSACYGEYYQGRTQLKQDLLTRFIREMNTVSTSNRTSRFANDRLEDLLIEPVQRLPRYSLYIDKILTLLPSEHPAAEQLAKAQTRITAICSMGESPQSATLRRLKFLIGPWPSDFQPNGRLVAIAEACEVQAPFGEIDDFEEDGDVLLLLFAGCLIMVKRATGSTLTAFALRKALERPDFPLTPAHAKALAGPQRSKPELTFRGWMSLNDVRASFSSSGKMLQLVIPSGMNDCTYERSRPSVQTYNMCGQYRHRANKWTEEMAKASILGRAPAVDNMWEMRQLRTKDSSLCVLFAVSEQDSPDARTKLVVNQGQRKHAQSQIDTTISICETSDPALYEVRVYGPDDSSRAHVGLSNFPTYLIRLLSTIARDRFLAKDPAICAAIASHNIKILKSLSIPEATAKKYRPPSPTKILSNFGSIKASFLSRSKSDAGHPNSSGGPNSSRPGSSESQQLFNLALLPPIHSLQATLTSASPSPTRKPKRRSSLSDLAALNLLDDVDTPSRRKAPPTPKELPVPTRSPQKRVPSGPRENTKKLEALFKQLNAENELLYEQYNSELLGLAKAARFGEANKALTEKLNTAQRDLFAMRAENMALKRRVAELEDSMTRS